MYLHAIETGLPAHIDCFAEIFHQSLDFFLAEFAMDGRGIHVKAGRRAHGHTAASVIMGHVAAMPQLYACFRPLRMYGICQTLQFWYYFGTHPQLPVERYSAAVYCTIGNRGHSYAAFGDRRVIVEQILRRFVSVAHVFERRRPYRAVAERNRP